jgi:hypothetical protein
MSGAPHDRPAADLYLRSESSYASAQRHNDGQVAVLAVAEKGSYEAAEKYRASENPLGANAFRVSRARSEQRHSASRAKRTVLTHRLPYRFARRVRVECARLGASPN